MTSAIKTAIQFPAEDDCGDCPDTVPSTEEVTGAAPANGHAESNRETDRTRLNQLRTRGRSMVMCLDEDDEDTSDEEDDDEDNLGDGKGIERQTINDQWKKEDGENVSCECFVCNHVTRGYEAADVMKTHIESFHDLSFEKLKSTFKLDYPSFVQFVRWARELKEQGIIEENIGRIWSLSTSEIKDLPWSSDKYLLPSSQHSPNSESNFPVDYFLTLDYFAKDEKEETLPTSGGYVFEDLVSEIERLQLDKERMAEIFQRVMSGNIDEQSTTPVRSPASSNSTSTRETTLSNGPRNTDRRAVKKSPVKQSQSNVDANDPKNHNKWYFDSYDDVSIHHDMIFDQSRTEAYRAAIIDRAVDIEGKVVMDLGCGSGILSMFCAQQGAKVVHAIDKSNIIFDAMSNSFENNFDKVIKFHHKDLDNDDTTDLEKEGKVDVLVSEFMGYFLFFEGMTESFIRARDKYLKPDGVLMPDTCVVELAPVGPAGIYQRKVRCWDTVYGFKMPALRERIVEEPLIDIVKPDEIIGSRVQVKDLDLRTCSKDDIYICDDFVFEFDQDTEFCAVVGFFSVDFNGSTKKITLSTSPWDPSTHWKQTVFFFTRPIKVTKGQKLSGSIKSCNHKSDPRWLIVLLEFGDEKFMYEIK